ncbi:hypothetical protein EVAR_69368_1 [Eumeta japonica]|uniref:Uncharacterized protein n=1 Tax=Eumeta variegata TaxID=151549 RepID=A0A4C1T9X6_EUMVA|nr:hypothetical protein EVAR_69368_1 [Eumeta japonica]
MKWMTKSRNPLYHLRTPPPESRISTGRTTAPRVRIYSASDVTRRVRNCVAVLSDINTYAYINNPQLVKELLEKLTPFLRNKYAKQLRRRKRDGAREPNLVILADFLDHEAELATVYARVSAASQPIAGQVPLPRPSLMLEKQASKGLIECMLKFSEKLGARSA